jgi:outer membrane protein
MNDIRMAALTVGRLSMRSVLFVVGCGAFIIATATARAQTALTLQQAVSMAVRHDTRLDEADAKQRSAENAAQIGAAHFRPSLFTGAGALYTYGFPQTPGGGPPAIFNLGLVRPLFDGPARGRASAAAERLEGQKQDAARVRADVALDTAATYLELASVRQTLARQRPATDAGRTLVQVLIDRLNESRALPVHVLEARLTAARVAQRVARLESRAVALEGQLRLLTGISGDEPLQVSLERLPSLPERSVSEMVAMAAANSPELKVAELERRARAAQAAGQRQAYWPSVDFVANYAIYSRLNNFDTFYARFQRNSVNVGVEAKVPIFNAESIAASALAASQRIEADVAVRRVRDRIELDVRSAWQRVHELAADRDVAELELAVAQEHARVAAARVAEGRGDRADAAKVVIDEAGAWAGFFQAEFVAEKAQLELRRITGELTQLFP